MSSSESNIAPSDPVTDDAIDSGNSNVTDDDKSDMGIAVMAQSEYERGDADQATRLLDRLPDSKSLTLNRLVCQFAIHKDCDSFLKGVESLQDLEPDQEALIDYNKALVYAKYMDRISDAIDLLEERKTKIDSGSCIIDDKLTIQIYTLLAVLYLENRTNANRALNLLTYVSDKCSSSSSAPARLQQLRARCALQLVNPKTAKRELKSIIGEPHLRCYQELQRGNCKKAYKIFNSMSSNNNNDQASNDQEQDQESLSLADRNNEALILFGLGKKNTAAFRLTKLLSDTLTSDPGSKPPPELLYNLALVHLFTGNTVSARALFEHLIHVYKDNPRLWFRLAECKLQEQTSSFFRDIEAARQKHELLKGYGEAGSKKLILKASESKGHDSESMCFVRSCLTNCLTIFQSSSSSLTSHLPSNLMPESEVTRFRTPVFLSLSFTNLCLQDPLPAYTYAKCALQLQPKAYQKILANMYAGESLALLDRIPDSIPHFSPSIITTEETTTSNTETESSLVPIPDFITSWYPNTARIILIYNQSVMHALKGDFEKATETLRQIGSSASQPDTVIPLQVITLVAYLQSQQGNVDGVKSLARQHLSHYRS